MTFIFVIFALVATAFSASYFLPLAVSKLIGIFIKPVGKHARRIGKVFFVGAVCCFIFGLAFGWRLVTVRHVDIFFDDLPEAFDGYIIAQLSDLHLGTYRFSHKTIAREVRKTMAEQPDIIVFTGDIVNYMPSELRPFTEILSGLHAPDGVWSIMGNHDYVMYNDRLTASQRARCIQEIQDMERSMGWRLLLNENAVVRHGKDSIALIGVENQGRRYPYPQRANLPKALSGVPDGMFKILLSHDPTFWESTVLPQKDIDLTLSGHTHAWQFRLWGISPSMLIFRQWAGLYTAPSALAPAAALSVPASSAPNTAPNAAHAVIQKLFVSTGSGGNIPFRFGSWPEIDILTLRRRPSASRNVLQ